MKDFLKTLDYSNYAPEKISYVVINILVSSLSFFKSFIFMKFLGLYDLGILTIIQTIMMSVGLLQFGFINGGYRIFAIGKTKETEQINNQIFTYIGVLTLLLLVVWICMLPVKLGFSRYLILIGILIGVMSLINNWLSNTLIAKQLFNKLNRFNLFSTLASLLALPLAFYFKVYGAIVVLLVQPGLFILFCLHQNKELRPTYLVIDKTLIRNILNYGFIPFLTGIFTLVTAQIERWSILGWLGTVSLGKFYLVFLFSSLYILIPNSLNNLFFPNTMKLYQTHDFSQIKQLVTRYYIILFIYIFIAVLLTLLFLNPLVSWLLPVHVEGVKYVYWIMPGLIFISLSDPIGLLYNASVILKPMFWAYFSSVILFIILLTISLTFNNLSLNIFAVFRGVIGTYIFIFFILSYYRFRKSIWMKQ